MKPKGNRMVGQHSRREFDPEAIGTPIRTLSAKSIKITPRGVDFVEQHLSRFGADKPNEIMLVRLRQIAAGSLTPASQDVSFYAHELREMIRYKLLGYPTGEPPKSDEARALWNNAHTATLEDYGLTENSRDPFTNPLYHPDAARYIER